MANISGFYGVQNAIARYSANLSANFNQLSSGKAINSAADNAAGLSAATQFNAEISAMGQAANNMGNGMALLSTADSGMGQVNDMLSQARELAVQSLNGTLNNNDRQALNQQFTNIMKGIDQVAQGTQFNGTQLLTGQLGQGAATPLTLQTGTGNNQASQMTINNIAAMDVNGLGLSGAAVDTPQNAYAALKNIDNAMKTVNQNQSGVAADINALSAGMQNLAVGQENLSYANSQIMGTDFGKVASDMMSNKTLQAAGLKVFKAEMQNNLSTVGTLLNVIG